MSDDVKPFHDTRPEAIQMMWKIITALEKRSPEHFRWERASLLPDAVSEVEIAWDKKKFKITVQEVKE